MKEFPRRVAVLHSIERGCDEGKSRGGMRERLKRAVLKTAVRETVPGVRIPLPPPLTRLAGKNLHNLLHNLLNPVSLLWSTRWRTVGALQRCGQLAHGRNCVYSGSFDVTRLRDRDGTVSQNCLNHRVIYSQPVQVRCETSTKSVPARPGNSCSSKHIFHVNTVETFQVKRPPKRIGEDRPR